MDTQQKTPAEVAQEQEWLRLRAARGAREGVELSTRQAGTGIHDGRVRCVVRVTFEAIDDGGAPGDELEQAGLWRYSHMLWTEVGGASGYVPAHEFGHLIGCYDEHASGTCQAGGQCVRAPNSIINNWSSASC